ncbi:MAG: DUF2141 domain-containing protein [Verrucomicrobia bacterium]|nr:DUF2141 domain-containing protein [Verrucomicrobiota bacterium]
MNRWLSLGLVLLVGATASAQENKSGTIQVVIEGVLSGQGQVRVALEKSAKDFDSGSFDTPKYLSRVEDAKGDKVRVTFPAVPYGTYAIKMFQDLDGDGKLKTGFMGAPEEPWGFSNDATGFMGPADFSDAKFELDTPELELTIRLQK